MVLRRDGGDGGISLFGADLVTEWLARLLRAGEPAAPRAARLERLVLGGARRYTRLEVEKRSGVPRDRTERLWRALGFADVDDDAKVFTDADIEALELIDGLVDSGLIDPTLEAGAARAAGQSLSRLAEWELGLLTQYAAKRLESGAAADEATVLGYAETILPTLERLHSYIWRRHIAALASPALGGSAEVASHALVVGFADLVGYTRLTRTLTETELEGLIERFESMTASVVATSAGRVVKTLGDEVLFVADNAPTGAAIGLGLLDAVDADGDMPDLRIGMAMGDVRGRFGDVYGPVVNIASRLTSAAKPGTIRVDRELASALAGTPGLHLRRHRPMSVRGYSHLSSWRLTRAAAPRVPLPTT